MLVRQKDKVSKDGKLIPVYRDFSLQAEIIRKDRAKKARIARGTRDVISDIDPTTGIIAGHIPITLAESG